MVIRFWTSRCVSFINTPNEYGLMVNQFRMLLCYGTNSIVAHEVAGLNPLPVFYFEPFLFGICTYDSGLRHSCTFYPFHVLP